MFQNRQFLQGIYASSSAISGGSYVSILRINQIDLVPGQTPFPPCPRVNIWREPGLVGSFITSVGQYEVFFNDVPEGLISGLDIFSWRIPILQTVTVNVTNKIEGIDYILTQEEIEEGTQTKTQLQYLSFGVFEIDISITN